MSTRYGVKCVGDDGVSRAAARRRSSAAAAGSGGGGGSAAAAGSWRRLRRPRDVRQFRDEYGDVPPTTTADCSLDDTISSTLEQLRVLQDGDCCVVRCFHTTDAGGLVNRGDSFKRRNQPAASADAGPTYRHFAVVTCRPSVLWHCWLGVRNSMRPVNVQ